MPIHITAQQLKQFSQFGWIEFEEFFPTGQIDEMLQTIRTRVAKRLKTSVEKLTRYTEENLYLTSRDLFRDEPALKQLFCSSQIPDCIEHFSKKRTLLLAFDQWICQEHIFSPLQMQAHFSFQQLVCGCLIALDGPFKGNVRFMLPERLPVYPDSQLLIGYGTPNSVYVHNAKDPLNASLKKMGYSFGDTLNAEHHPVCKSNISRL